MNLTTDRSGASSHTASRSQSALLATVVALAGAMALVFALDRSTGVPGVQHLYYVPIIFAATRFGPIGGGLTAAAAIVLYHLANPHLLIWRYEELDVVQMAVFVAVGSVSAKLASNARRLRQLAVTDDLTGLHNLRSFEHELRRMARTARQTGTPLSLLVLDVDRLKTLNDERGHLAGAEAVRTVGRIIADRIPAGAIACRYGGDEFVIALPECPSAAARRVADELRRAVLTSAPMLAGVPFPKGTLSISVGLACHSYDSATLPAPAPDADDGEQLFRTADAALYTAKNAGRNRVMAFR